jgi:hypothetical protein
MSQSDIFGKGWNALPPGGGLHPGTQLAQRPSPAEAHSSPRRQMLVNVDFLDEAHSCSSLSVASLNGARLEQNLES